MLMTSTFPHHIYFWKENVEKKMDTNTTDTSLHPPLPSVIPSLSRNFPSALSDCRAWRELPETCLDDYFDHYSVDKVQTIVLLHQCPYVPQAKRTVWRRKNISIIQSSNWPDVPQFDCLVLAVAYKVSPVPLWIKEGNSINVAWKLKIAEQIFC